MELKLMKNSTKKYWKAFIQFCFLFFTLVLLFTQPLLAFNGNPASTVEVESPIDLARKYNLSTYYLDENGVGLVFVGTRHTFDSKDSQIEGLERLFEKFKPTLVLLEGGEWPVANSKEDAIKRYGEIGFTRFLASRRSVNTLSADPQTFEEYFSVLKRHTAIETKLYYALRFVPQWSREKSVVSIDEKMSKFLNPTNFPQYVLAESAPRNIKDLEMLCAQLIPNLKDWRTVQFDLTFDGGNSVLLNEIDKTANTFRNQFIEEKILSGLEKGERVFIVTGVTHLAKILPELRKKLSKLKK